MTSTRGEKIFYIINYIFLTLVTLSALFPFVNTIAVSFSSERAVISGEVTIFPVEATLETYQAVVTRSPIIQALVNTVIVTVVGVVINMVLTTLAAYSLSKKRLRGRQVILIMITFTMLFRAGLI